MPTAQDFSDATKLLNVSLAQNNLPPFATLVESDPEEAIDPSQLKRPHSLSTSLKGLMDLNIRVESYEEALEVFEFALRLSPLDKMLLDKGFSSYLFAREELRRAVRNGLNEERAEERAEELGYYAEVLHEAFRKYLQIKFNYSEEEGLPSSVKELKGEEQRTCGWAIRAAARIAQHLGEESEDENSAAEYFCDAIDHAKEVLFLAGLPEEMDELEQAIKSGIRSGDIGSRSVARALEIIGIANDELFQMEEDPEDLVDAWLAYRLASRFDTSDVSVNRAAKLKALLPNIEGVVADHLRARGQD